MKVKLQEQIEDGHWIWSLFNRVHDGQSIWSSRPWLLPDWMKSARSFIRKRDRFVLSVGCYGSKKKKKKKKKISLGSQNMDTPSRGPMSLISPALLSMLEHEAHLKITVPGGPYICATRQWSGFPKVMYLETLFLKGGKRSKEIASPEIRL